MSRVRGWPIPSAGGAELVERDGKVLNVLTLGGTVAVQQNKVGAPVVD